jgi:transcriptional regulator with XRE-family HTH domain
LKLPRLKEVRELHGWSQTKLAEESGVSRDSISNYETGQREAYPATAKRLADALDVEIAELIEPAREPALPKADAPRETGPARVEQQWESALASVRQRQSEVEAKVEELLELPDRSEANPYEVKWVLDEAQDCAITLMLALPSSQQQGEKITFNPLAVRPDQWKEFQNASGFYNNVVESLVEVGLVTLREREGQRAEPVPVGIGA